MNPTSSPSTIIGLDGKPITAGDGKRYAIVGTVNVHATVFELAESENMQTAIKRQQIMVRNKDPRLANQTHSTVIFWAEDDATRRHNRIALMQQIMAHFELMTEKGETPFRKDAFELTDEMLGRSEKGNGDESPAA